MRVLLVEPGESDRRELMKRAAACLPAGTEVQAVRSAEDALVLIKQGDFDVVVAEYRLPRLSGTDLFIFLQKYAPDTLRVLTTFLNQMSFIRRVQAMADPHLTLVKTGDMEGLCNELLAFLGTKGLLPTPDEPGQAASRAETGKAR